MTRRLEPTILDLVETSGLFSLTASQALYDYRQAVTDRPHVVGLTEIDKFHPQLQRVEGYKPVTFTKANDVAFLVCSDVKVLRKGKRLAYDAPTGRNVWIVWVRVQIGRERITVHLCHWLAKVWQYQDKPDATSWRMRAHTKTTRLMCRLVRAHGRRRNLSFFMGDLNVDFYRDGGTDTRYPAHLFEINGLVPVWGSPAGLRARRASKGSHGGRLIDVIGHYSRDARVQPLGADVMPRRYSDHRAVAATYRISS